MGIGSSLATLTGVSKESPGSSLKGFLAKFNSSEGRYADVIDPLNTFDVTMYFYPCIRTASMKTHTENLFKSKKARQDLAKSIGNSLSGGLLGSFMNDKYGKDVEKLKSEFVKNTKKLGN